MDLLGKGLTQEVEEIQAPLNGFLTGAHHQERLYILGGVPSTVADLWLFLELKFPAKTVSIVPVVVGHRLAFSYDLLLLLLQNVCRFI